MTRHIILTAGLAREDRITTARVIARENRWPLLSIEDLDGALTRGVLGDATGRPDDRTTPTFKHVIEPAHLDSLLTLMWAQVEADVEGVVLSAPLLSQLHDPTWVDELNYDLALRGYEATVIYVLSPGESAPTLDPEHYVINASQDVDALFTTATHLAIDLR